MKRAVLFLLVIIIGVAGFFGGKHLLEEIRVNTIKKGWYVEILYDKGINIRADHNTESEAVSTAETGKVYKVLDIYLDSKVYYWYKIEYKGGEGWVANKRGERWLKDGNNPNDIAAPTIKFKEDIYKTTDINNISYNHLDVWDDKDEVKITHKIYYEFNYVESRYKYWIAYTATDAVGKSTTKLQKIEFEEEPDRELLEDLVEYKKQS